MTQLAASSASLPRFPGLRSTFTITVFLGSFLLFLVQPLFARLALPVLGGSASVWNTAMLFYQASLLVGYAYAHLIRRLAFRKQALLHIGLFLLAALTLPITIIRPEGAFSGNAAIWWLLQLLLLSIGPVFILISSQAPLMQSWFARSDEPHAAQPYFLYAASNLGSLGGLLAYPFLLEPLTTLGFQQIIWSVGYVLLLLLIAGCALLLWQSAPVRQATETTPSAADLSPTWGRRIYWLLLAAVPSGLLLSTTTHLTTDIMAMPLLWVLPLAAYLISYILAFSRHAALATRLCITVSPLLLIIFGGAGIILASMSASMFGLSSILLLFVIATALHGTLSATRPPVSRLTEFYLLLSLGGVLGGIFAAIIAPLLFDWTYEHPTLLLAAALLLPARPWAGWLSRLWVGRRLVARAMRILAPPLLLALGWWLGFSLDILNPSAVQIICLLLMLAVLLLAIGRPIMFTWSLAMMMLGLGGWQQIDISTIEGARQRSFFGIYTIENNLLTQSRQLLHGTTVHGSQSLDPARSRVPTTYYAPASGIGRAMEAVSTLYGPQARIGVVGLGAGTLACYAAPLQSWTAYEIDPMVVRLATDPAYFSYIAECRPDLHIVIGDARLKLAEEPAGQFDLLAIDAFSSDAIPLHLLTREAFQVYFHNLSANGVLLVHISNRFLDLEPVLAAISADLGLAARQLIYRPSAEEQAIGYNMSFWVALTRQEAGMTRFTEAAGNSGDWALLENRRSLAAWSDDRASVIPVLKSLRGNRPWLMKDREPKKD